jgi:hypothetical protein
MAQGLTLAQLQAHGAKPVGLTPQQLQAQGAKPLTISSTGTAPQQADTIPGPLDAAKQTLENIPSSAASFAGGVIKSLNPIQAGKNVIDYFKGFDQLSKDLGNNPSDAALAVVKEVPHTLYNAFVPSFVQSLLHGDTASAEKAIVNDPVGQIAPLLMYGKGVAEKAGVGPEFDAAISKAAAPIVSPAASAASKVGNIAKTVSEQVLGASTGTGASSIRAAAQGSDTFVQAMRGNINPDDIVRSAQDAVENIANNRRSTYLNDLSAISQNKTALDISPIHDTLTTQLKAFNVRPNTDGTLDFSRSAIANNASARADIQGVYDTVKSWGTQKGDRTPVGLDTLKKQLGDFYTQSGSARAFVQSIKGAVSNALKTNVPGYDAMTSKYTSASNLLSDIKSATGAGSNAKVDTIFTKLTTAMKADKDLRLEVMQQMQAAGDQPQLMDQIAGINMQSWIPRGLVGKGADVAAAMSFLLHSFNPSVIPALLSTSPRVVGEFVRTMGISADKVAKITDAINTVTPALAKSFAPVGTAQSNRSLEQTQQP